MTLDKTLSKPLQALILISSLVSPTITAKTLLPTKPMPIHGSKDNIKNHLNVKFRYIAVRNEVNPTGGQAGFVLPAMQNINKAISSAGLTNQIKVSTAIDTGVLGVSYPPSSGAFKNEALSFLNPIISFLVNNNSPLLLSLEFSESTDRQGMNLTARTCKTNKGPKVVCRPALRCLS